MDVGLILVISIGVLAATIFAWPVWFRAWVRHRRKSDPRFIPPLGLGVFDEIYRPATYAATQEQKQEARKTDETGARER
jgi:hypothetical protein